jgi:hypothetical protein
LKDDSDARLNITVPKLKTAANTYVSQTATSAGNAKVSIEELETGISDDTKSKLKVSPYCVDEFGEVSRFLGDNVFHGSLITIPPEHHEIHCGDSYEMTHSIDLTNGQIYNILIIVPNATGTGQAQKLWHFKGEVDTEAEALIEFFEGPTYSAAGTGLTSVNRNRQLAASYTDYLGITYTPTLTGDGTRIFIKRVGSGRSSGGSATRSDEFVLKNNTAYLLRVTNATTTANWCNFDLNYYVHPGI